MLKKRIKLNIPLKGISFHESEIGFSFKWNRLRLLLPYHRLPITASLGPILEEFKTAFDGSVSIFLEGNRFNFKSEVTEVMVSEDVIHQFSQLTSRIEDVIKQIESLAEQERLTFEKSQIILYQKGFQFDDSRVHRILLRIIDWLPPRKIVEKVSFPLANLKYDSDGIRFYDKQTKFSINKDRLPVEVGPALERIKSNFSGHIIFHIETEYLQKWNSEQGNIQSGQISREIKEIEIPPAIPTAFRTQRNHFIVEAVKTSIRNKTISKENVRLLLEDWGLSTTHQEIALELIGNIDPWTEEKDIRVPLQDITFSTDSIVVPLEGRNMRIPGKNLTFDTHQLLNDFKQSLEGGIDIHLFQPLQFKWNEDKGRLEIVAQKSVKIKLNIDDDTLTQLKRFYWLVVEKGVKIGADGSLLEQFNYADNESSGINQEETPEYGIETVQEKTGPQVATDEEVTVEESRLEEKNTAEAETSPEEEFILDLPRSIEKLPLSLLEKNGYDVQCMQFLEEIADKMYMTTEDFWFRIGNRLAWERPGEKSATYIFEWPEEELEFFVGKIWVSELKEIREDREGTGFITRVNHTPEDPKRWKTNLKRALKKTIKK